MVRQEGPQVPSSLRSGPHCLLLRVFPCARQVPPGTACRRQVGSLRPAGPPLCGNSAILQVAHYPEDLRAEIGQQAAFLRVAPGDQSWPPGRPGPGHDAAIASGCRCEGIRGYFASGPVALPRPGWPSPLGASTSRGSGTRPGTLDTLRPGGTTGDPLHLRRGRSQLWSDTGVAGSQVARMDTSYVVEGTGAPRGTRTPNLLIRSQVLYPIELSARPIGRGSISTDVALGKRG
jgi:hypothetical protein